MERERERARLENEIRTQLELVQDCPHLESLLKRLWINVRIARTSERLLTLRRSSAWTSPVRG